MLFYTKKTAYKVLRYDLLISIGLLLQSTCATSLKFEELPKHIFVTQINYFLDNNDLVALAQTNKSFYDVFLSIPYKSKYKLSLYIDKQTKLDQLTQSKSAQKRLTELELSNSSFVNNILSNIHNKYTSDDEDLNYDYTVEEESDLSSFEIFQRGYQKWNNTHQSADAISTLSQLSNLDNLQILSLTSFMPDSVVANLILPNKLRYFSLDCVYVNDIKVFNHLSFPHSLQEIFFINLEAHKLNPDSIFSSSLINLKQLKSFNLITPYSLPFSPLRERITFLSIDDSFNTDKSSEPYSFIINENFDVNDIVANFLAGENLNVDQIVLPNIEYEKKNKKPIDLSSLKSFSNLETFFSLLTSSERIVALDLPDFLKIIRVDCRGISSDVFNHLKLTASIETFGLEKPDFSTEYLNALLTHKIPFVLISPQNLPVPHVGKHVKSLLYDKGDESIIEKTDFSSLDVFDHLELIEIKAEISQKKLNQIIWPQSLKYLHLNCQLIEQQWLENWMLPANLTKLILENANLEILTNDSTFLINFPLIPHIEILSPKSLPKFDLTDYNSQAKVEKDKMESDKKFLNYMLSQSHHDDY